MAINHITVSLPSLILHRNADVIEVAGSYTLLEDAAGKMFRFIGNLPSTMYLPDIGVEDAVMFVGNVGTSPLTFNAAALAGSRGTVLLPGLAALLIHVGSGEWYVLGGVV